MLSISADSIFIFSAFWAAYYTRMGELENFIYNSKYWLLLVSLTCITLAIFIKSGLYRAILRYMSSFAVLSVCVTAGISALSMVLLSYYFQLFLPRSVPIIYATYLVVLVGGSRMLIRQYIHSILVNQREAVLIYGAGSAGRQLANLIKQGSEYKVVCFLDDNKALHNTIIQGVSVKPPSQLKNILNQKNVSKVLLAIPSSSRTERRAIVERLAENQLEVLTIPNLVDILNGGIEIDQLKEVSIEDLLGRDPVKPNEQLLQANITGKVVMVTGAGGSIGSELCRQILQLGPTCLVLFERSEFALYSIEGDLSSIAVENDIELVPILGNVQDGARLNEVMESFAVETVYHAAAYKHVPLVEFNMTEGVMNNVNGTYQTALAAIQSGVKSFVLISTDKAVRPTNVMGTTKRLAELSLQALAQQESSKADGTRFCMVRFGNVLGSSGSVIPLFKKQIESGGPVTVTHPDITRYFMTIPEAAQLVIQAGAMGEGGDVFVLDMGEPVKIRQLAENLIHLSGRDVKHENNSLGDIEIVYSGLRHGEKLYEELLIGNNVQATQHPRIMVASELSLSMSEFEPLIDQIIQVSKSRHYDELMALLISSPTDFSPSDGIGDLCWKRTLNL